ncbi:MAG: hypothetical protein OXI30_04410, partial [Chloroflexota bacterium]|nr:hypothetical protein [Chloroflexota bacterium]
TVASLKLDLNVTLGKENRGEQLWALIYQRLTQSQDSRMRDLLYRGSEGTLTKQEKAELKYHVDLVDRQMLLRSRALVLLKERGHDIDSYLGVGA